MPSATRTRYREVYQLTPPLTVGGDDLNMVTQKKDPLELSHQLPMGATVLVHIGKCGGRTLKDGIKNAVRNSNVYVVHIRKPVYREDLNYIIVAREPVSRLMSAFRWRYKLVVADGSQRDRFEGEYAVLVKYGHLNNLAEALYHKDGSVNYTAQQEMRRIHHIREDISFYLRELLCRCRPNQIAAVLMQENLDNDIFRVFGYRNTLRRHTNPATGEDRELSEFGLANLMKFFSEDYEAITKLYCWGKIERRIFMEAIEYKSIQRHMTAFPLRTNVAGVLTSRDVETSPLNTKMV